MIMDDLEGPLPEGLAEDSGVTEAEKASWRATLQPPRSWMEFPDTAVDSADSDPRTERLEPDKQKPQPSAEPGHELGQWLADLVATKGPPSKEAAGDAGATLIDGLGPRQVKLANLTKLAVEGLKAGNDIDPRSALGQKIERDMQPAQKEQYRKLTSKGKADFRANWAKEKMTEFFVSRRQTESWRHIDRKHGVYCSVTRAHQLQGGTADDIPATKCLVEKCHAMGEPWVSWNWQTERWDVLVLTKEFSEEFERCWSKFKEHSKTGTKRSATEAGTTFPDADGNPPEVVPNQTTTEKMFSFPANNRSYYTRKRLTTFFYKQDKRRSLRS